MAARPPGGALLLAASLLWAVPSAPPLQAASVEVRVTDADGRPVKDAVVFVREVKGKSFPPPEEPYIMDQVNKEFVPHLLPVLVGGKVRFPNKDDIFHHVYSFSPSKTFDMPLYKGEPTQPIVFDAPGVVKLACNIHDWMQGIILVLPNPFYAVTDDRGAARLDIPDQDGLELMVFHELLKGPVEDTRKTVSFRDGRPLPAAWTLPLKPFRKKQGSAFDY